MEHFLSITYDARRHTERRCWPFDNMKRGDVMYVRPVDAAAAVSAMRAYVSRRVHLLFVHEPQPDGTTRITRTI